MLGVHIGISLCVQLAVYLCFIFRALKCALQVLTVTGVSRAGEGLPQTFCILHLSHED